MRTHTRAHTHTTRACRVGVGDGAQEGRVPRGGARGAGEEHTEGTHTQQTYTHTHTHLHTQVRKAIKFKVPIVSPDFVEACARAGKVVDAAPFEIHHSIPDAVVLVPADDVSGLSDAEAAEHDVVAGGEWTDLGCCCSCHDDPAIVECPWCVTNPNCAAYAEQE